MIANLMISGKEDEVFLRFLALPPKRLSTARATCGEQKGYVPPSKKGSVPL